MTFSLFTMTCANSPIVCITISSLVALRPRSLAIARRSQDILSLDVGPPFVDIRINVIPQPSRRCRIRMTRCIQRPPIPR
ncbi:hypothetical protein C8J56DRAFT_1057988 [Mycena floridula]|nr:hypothetical protein C8J56DRAFT_1057988 [Mycena floridula]